MDKQVLGGRLDVNCFQTYLNVKRQIDHSDLSDEAKDQEDEAVKQARMSAWMAQGCHPSQCNF